MESRNVIIPGIIALVMVVIAAMLTSVTVAREWETGTMEQLISTPIRVPELVLARWCPILRSAGGCGHRRGHGPLDFRRAVTGQHRIAVS
jgi:ABC-type multidrug transport system permease subunit